MVKGHGNIKAYFYRFRTKDRPMCTCKRREQTIDHKLFNGELVEQQRDISKAAMLRTENWTMTKIYL